MNKSKAGLSFVALTLVSVPLFAQQGPPPRPVSVAAVTLTEITPTVPVAGTVHSRNDVQITAGVAGPLVFVAEPGTFVEKGDVVARVDDTNLRLQKREQQALAERARISLRFLNSSLERQRSLASTQSTSVDQLEQTESDRDVAESDLAIAGLRLDQIQEQLDRTVVRAPFDGVITERLQREGEYVAPGSVMARMTDVDTLEVRVDVPVNYAGRVRVGDNLRMFGFESEFFGTIRAIIPASDVRTQAFEIRVDLPDDAGQQWAIGQLVSAAVPMRSAEEALAVPRDALILRREGTFVFRIGEENKAQRVAVEVGDGEGEMVAVTGDLSEGDQVAIRGAETLQEGATVSIVGQAQIAGSANSSNGGLEK